MLRHMRREYRALARHILDRRESLLDGVPVAARVNAVLEAIGDEVDQVVGGAVVVLEALVVVAPVGDEGPAVFGAFYIDGGDFGRRDSDWGGWRGGGDGGCCGIGVWVCGWGGR